LFEIGNEHFETRDLGALLFDDELRSGQLFTELLIRGRVVEGRGVVG
jgi:hypothetical protein